MIEVSVFGWLIATLASAASVVFLLLALGSAAFVALTAASALEQRFAEQASRALEPGPWDPPRVRRTALIAGALWALLAFALGAAGLRVGGFVVLTSLVLAAGSIATFGAAALATLLGLRAVAAIVHARGRRLAALHKAEREQARLLEESRRRYLEGADLREQVADAEAALLRLRAALRSLEDMKVELDVKLEALEAAGIKEGSPEARAAADYARLRDAIRAKLDLGERVLSAAEVAVFRLACFEPLRRLLRRRPQEATSGLARVRTGGPLRALVEAPRSLPRGIARRPAEARAGRDRRGRGGVPGGARPGGRGAGEARGARGDRAGDPGGGGPVRERARARRGRGRPPAAPRRGGAGRVGDVDHGPAG
jgi:hypothetical protein